MKTFLSSKYTPWILLAAILVMGFFLRSYHLASWLHFELDQARDARVVDLAFEGDPLDLPLLGPKAGGTYLRLPPTFYELQYVSGLLFGKTPAGITILSMLLSVATIGVFFLLARRFFSKPIALSLTFLSAVSLYLILYSRFSWNPNLIPFFMVSGFYALLRAVDPDEPKKEHWFIGAAFLLTLATHLHFLAFLAVPAITLIFLALVRPRIKLWAWVASLLVVAFLFFPVVLNEVSTGGKNVQQFLGAVDEKSEANRHNTLDKMAQSGVEFVLHSVVVTSGFEGATFPLIEFHDGRPWWLCETKCDQGKWYGMGTSLILLASFVALFWLWKKESSQTKKQFLLLCGLWTIFPYIIFIPLAFDVAPRFSLLVAPLFFLYIGFLFLAVYRFVWRQPLVWWVFGAVVLFLGASNLYFTHLRFSELRQAGTVNIESAPDRILKEKIRVTFEQQERLADFMEAKAKGTGYPIYMYSEPEYRRAIKYHLQEKGLEEDALSLKGVYRQGIYFVIFRTQSDLDASLKKYQEKYVPGERTAFGTLTVIELAPREEAIIGERQDFSVIKPEDSKVPPRYTWRDFLFGKSNVGMDDPDLLEGEE